jgi:hypothetical protein
LPVDPDVDGDPADAAADDVFDELADDAEPEPAADVLTVLPPPQAATATAIPAAAARPLRRRRRPVDRGRGA